MQKKLVSWKVKFLNIAGRTPLAISALNSISSHAMQYTYLPNKILSQIDCILRNFIWGSTDETNKIHYVNWDTVTKQKEEGGLGITKAKSKNIIYSKQTYLENPNNLWSRIIIFKYANKSPKTQSSFI